MENDQGKTKRKNTRVLRETTMYENNTKVGKKREKEKENIKGIRRSSHN